MIFHGLAFSNEVKLMFYEFIRGNIAVSDFEQWVYKNEPELAALSDEFSYEMISFDYKKRDAKSDMSGFLYYSVIDKADYSEWMIRNCLNEIIQNKNLFQASCILYGDYWDDNSKMQFLATLCDYLAPQIGDNPYFGFVGCSSEVRTRIIDEYLRPETVKEAKHLINDLDSGIVKITGEYQFDDFRSNKRKTIFNDILTEIRKRRASYESEML